MRIASRINRLESLHRNRLCSVCAGKGKVVVAWMNDGEPQPAVTDGCPEWGLADPLYVIWTNETADGRRMPCPS